VSDDNVLKLLMTVHFCLTVHVTRFKSCIQPPTTKKTRFTAISSG